MGPGSTPTPPARRFRYVPQFRRFGTRAPAEKGGAPQPFPVRVGRRGTAEFAEVSEPLLTRRRPPERHRRDLPRHHLAVHDRRLGLPHGSGSLRPGAGGEQSAKKCAGSRDGAAPLRGARPHGGRSKAVTVSGGLAADMRDGWLDVVARDLQRRRSHRVGPTRSPRARRARFARATGVSPAYRQRAGDTSRAGGRSVLDRRARLGYQVAGTTGRMAIRWRGSTRPPRPRRAVRSTGASGWRASHARVPRGKPTGRPIHADIARDHGPQAIWEVTMSIWPSTQNGRNRQKPPATDALPKALCHMGLRAKARA
jgi:hypothetical protein